MKKIAIIIFPVIAILLSCEIKKVDPDREEPQILRITKNSKLYAEYKYSNSQMIYFKDYSGTEFEESLFEYNSLNILNNVTILDKNGDMITRNEFAYIHDSLISSVTVYKIKDDIESIIEIKYFEYDSLKRLTKIDAYFPETFEYFENDIVKHGEVNISTQTWTEYTYTYDEEINVLANIGMPLIAVEHISKHNINSVTSHWIELSFENLGEIIEIYHDDLIYTSIFEYNENGYPKIEYRNYSNKIDTIRYMYE